MHSAVNHAAEENGALDLSAYERRKFALADIVRQAVPSSSNTRNPLYDQFLEFFARLAEDRFNLVVAGRFSRGKSSLMNAILGLDRLPTGIVPLTSVITSVAYGSRESVHIEWQRRGLPIEISMDELADYVTEKGNPGNIRSIRLARIELPAEILRRGFYFVDTPGLGSAIEANTKTAMEFLAEADALILVTGYESPLSEEELRVLHLAAASNLTVFLILNKQDTVAADARAEVLEFVRNQASDMFGEQAPRIFSTSALEGLRAQLEERPALLARSGLPDVQIALNDFLLTRKTQEFLLRMIERAHQLVDAAVHLADGIRDELSKRLEEERQGLGAAQRALRHGDRGRFPAVPAISMPVEACELCSSLNSRFFEFLCQYQHRLATNAQTRSQFAHDGGLCPRHFWMYASLAAPRDLSVVLAPLLSQTASALQQASSADHNHSLDERLQCWRVPRCELCVLQQQIEGEIIKRLAVRSARSDDEASIPLPSLCMPHLRMMGQKLESEEVVRELLAAQARKAERLAEDAQRYALKRDSLRQYLTSDEERNASKEALGAMAGLRSMIG